MDEKKLLDQLELQKRLISRISHNLRTPITAVLGVSEVMLHDASLPAHIEEAFRRIQNSGKIMLGVANDILALTKLESGDLPLANAPYDIAALISEITQLHLIHLGSRSIEYKVKISPVIPATLIGDEFRVKQIIDNLLANAFKHTETGVIKLTADWEESESTRGSLILNLVDTGLGESDITITQEIAKTLNAEIKIQNEPGMGTQINVIIPQEKTQSDAKIGADTMQSLSRFQGASQSHTIEPVPMPYGTALVVDDVEACLFLVKGMLGFYEIQTDLAANGGEVIEKIINGNSYDVIFMDHLMPELDGVAATKALRNMGYTLPIVALTANAFGNEAEYLAAGFNAYISKPINPEEFDAALHKYVRDVQPQHVLDAVAERIKEEPQETDNPTIQTEIAEKLRQDFARKQRNVYTEITMALGNGETEAAQWHLDTVKSMAGMIGEPILTKVASDVSVAIANGEIPAQLLEMLNQELTTVLAGIPEDSDRNQTNPLTPSEIKTLFDTVQELLETDSAECTFLIEKLQLITDTEELIKNIENFDFPAALLSLEALRI